MTESEWLRGDDLTRMWAVARGHLSLRRTFLAGIARAKVCWKVPPRGVCRSAVQFMEQTAETLTGILARPDFQKLTADNAFVQLFTRLNAGPAPAQAAVIRDVTGNPFRRVNFDHDWETSTVIELATGIYRDSAFDRLPILADALQDAGCEDADILDHCRGGGPHVRGCWVIDRVLDHD